MYKRIIKELTSDCKSYICDTEADVENLPTCCCGSSAFVVETGAVYVVNASGVWAKVGG
jgi:hypothetical protein